MIARLKKRTNVPLDEHQAAELAEVFHLMGDANRLRILTAAFDGRLSVSEIAARLALPISLVSHHLRLLRAARVVRAERRGKNVFYALADDHIRRVLADMTEHVREPDSDPIER